MRLQELVDEGQARRYDYDDRSVFAVDFGPGAAPSVDVVDDVVIFVTPGGRQRELELPDGDVRAFNRNGVVSIEVRQ